MNTRKSSADQATHGGGKRSAEGTSSDDAEMTSKRNRTALDGDKEPQPQDPVKQATTPF